MDLAAPARVRASRPEFHQLEILLAVVETGSFSAAARKMGRTQPAVSQAIGRLEDLYGAPLFKRRPGLPLELTALGEALLPSARLLLTIVDDQMRRAVEAAKTGSGTLSIGFGLGFAAGPLSAAIAPFRANYPNAHLKFVEAPLSELDRHLRRNAIDLFLAPARLSPVDDSFVREHVGSERLVAVMRDDHPLAKRSRLTQRDLTRSRFLRSASSVGARADGEPSYELHDVSEVRLLDLVSLGMGPAIVLEIAVVPKPGLTVRPTGLKPVAIEAVWRAGDANSLRHFFIELIRAAAHATE